MDFGLAFSYPFQDQDWAKKILIPALISIIPIIGQIFLLGWALDITRRVIRHDPTPLPELDFGKQFIDGLKAVVVGFVYTIPLYVLMAPSQVMSAMIQNGNMDSNMTSTMYALISVCCSGLSVLYSLVLGFVLPAAYANIVVHESLGAGFRFSEIWGLVRAAPGAYLIVLVASFVTGIISALGLIACLIGVFFTYAYAMSVNGHLYGQAYLEGKRNASLVG